MTAGICAPAVVSLTSCHAEPAPVGSEQEANKAGTSALKAGYDIQTGDNVLVVSMGEYELTKKWQQILKNCVGESKER